MAVIRENLQGGVITADLSAGATSWTMAEFANLPEVVAPNILKLVAESEIPALGGRVAECIYVGAHTAGSPTVTSLSRGMEQSSTGFGPARDHLAVNLESWRHAMTVSDLLSNLFINVRDPIYGAKGDDTADDTQAFIDAYAAAKAAGGATVHVPFGRYRVDVAAIALNNISDVLTLGVSETSSIIHNTGTDDTFAVSGSCERLKWYHLGFVSDSGAGHIFNAGASTCSYWHWDYSSFETADPASSAWHQTDGDYQGMHVEHFNFTADPSASVYFWNVVNNSGGANGNTWEQGRSNCYGNYAINVEGTLAATWAYDNTVKDIIFEIPLGGCVRARGVNRFTVENCATWDFSGPTTADLFDIGAGGSASRYITMRGVTRRGGTLGAGLADIKVDTCAVVLLEMCDNAVFHGFTVNGNGSAQITAIACGYGDDPTHGITWLNRPTDTAELGGAHVGASHQWQTYTPAVSGSGWAVVDGTITGRYAIIGRTVHWTAHWVMGSSDTAGGGNLAISLPLAASAVRFDEAVAGMVLDAGTGWYSLSGRMATTTAAQPFALGAGGAVAFVTNGSPITFAPSNHDEIAMWGTYEVA